MCHVFWFVYVLNCIFPWNMLEIFKNTFSKCIILYCFVDQNNKSQLNVCYY
uniref:Alternative protein PPM1A n=1 Tax=Homo sapiens TaxID=9606 RepID=L8EAT3_HUMAN|nr:alternative protein PPM1A [Homo sapiens]